nr:hypothetical protein HK105_005852 [Polyrhizophydium stewartii]
MTSLFKKYGNVVRVIVFGNEIVFVGDPALVRRSFANTTDFRRSEQFKRTAVGLMDNSLVTLQTGEDWARHRKLLQPAFGPGPLRRIARITNQVYDEVLDHYAHLCAAAVQNSVVVDLYEEFTALTLDLIGLIAFSHDFKARDDLHNNADSKGREMMARLMAIMQKKHPADEHDHQRISRPVGWEQAGIAPTSPGVIEVQNYIRTLLQSVIDKKVASRNGGAVVTDDEIDILDRLIGANEKGTFTTAEVFGEVVGMFVGGHETTANTLTMTLLEIGSNPEIAARLTREIDALLPRIEAAGGLNPENIHDFKYLEAVMRESQRLHTIVGGLPRQVARDFEYEGYHFKAGTRLIVSIADAHMNETNFPNPHVYDPERWLAAPDRMPPAGSFLPFGDGPTKCIGQKMAIIEIKVCGSRWMRHHTCAGILLTLEAQMVIIKLLRRFQVELVKDQKVELITTLTMGPKHGLKFHLTPRKHV